MTTTKRPANTGGAPLNAPTVPASTDTDWWTDPRLAYAQGLSDACPHARATLGLCPPAGCPGFTAEQVARAVAQAYQRGREDERRQLVDLGDDRPAELRKTREQYVAERLAALPAPKPLRFDDSDWPPVAVPGVPGLRLGPEGGERR